MTSQPTLPICLAGTGNVAWHLMRALCQDLNVIAVASRTKERAAEFVAHSDIENIAIPSIDLQHVKRLRPDIIIISVADSGIKGYANAIGHLDYKPLVLHTSGTVSMDVLRVISPRVGVLYPLQTFTKGKYVDLKRVPFFTETSESADLPLVDALGAAIGGKIYHADEELRRVLHIAGVFSSNFIIVLLEAVEGILSDAGYDLEAVRPLVEATIEKAFAIGPHNAMTGPAKRGDKEVVRRQYDALSSALKPSYKALTQLIEHYHHNEQN